MGQGGSFRGTAVFNSGTVVRLFQAYQRVIRAPLVPYQSMNR